MVWVDVCPCLVRVLKVVVSLRAADLDGGDQAAPEAFPSNDVALLGGWMPKALPREARRAAAVAARSMVGGWAGRMAYLVPLQLGHW